MRQDRINLESSSVFGRNFVGSQQSLLLASPFALSQTHSTALLITKIVMGFTTGFIGGIALTSSLFYISLNLHERNRLYQSSLLRQQSNLLRNITDPQPKEPSQTARHLVPGLADRLKYRWNTELEAAVRKIQHFDWDQWRREAEDKVSSVFSKGLGSAVDEAEKKTS
ncbi:hypothetical protein KCU97_g7182, partial [Aureobasidium melanogenum]